MEKKTSANQNSLLLSFEELEKNLARQEIKKFITESIKKREDILLGKVDTELDIDTVKYTGTKVLRHENAILYSIINYHDTIKNKTGIYT